MVTKTRTYHCIICDKRPAIPETGYCHNCTGKIDAIRREGSHREPQPEKFFTYRGIVVACYNRGDTFTTKLSQKSAEKLPKGRTLDLNTWLDGYTREQVKRFKGICLHLGGHLLVKEPVKIVKNDKGGKSNGHKVKGN
ncbi:MAG: hypothetical protein PHI12_08430 [Dehalococcoidales bacterium]|nr:hypothetical protein [Dehalococcoidales bacterium]